MKFQDDISNMNTYIHTDKPKPICPPLFQVGGIININFLLMFRVFLCFRPKYFRTSALPVLK